MVVRRRPGVITSVMTALLALMMAMVGFGGVAFAEEPITIKTNVTDETGTVSDVSAIETTLMELRDQTGNSLYVVFVNDFGDTGYQSWARQSFQQTGLDNDDSLIAIAVDSHQMSVHSGGSGFTKDQLEKAINSAVTDKWHNDDWAGGFDALSKNLSGGGGFSGTSIIILLVLLAAGGAFLYIRSTRQKKAVERKATTDLLALQKQASEALLGADDGVRAAAGELEFARAEFGIEATAPFAAALAQAQQAVQQAFHIQKRLDDDIPETPQEQVQLNSQILQLTGNARTTIAQHEAGFQEMRDLASRVLENLDEQETRSREIASRVETARAQLDSLKMMYPESALESLSSYPAQIETLLNAAHQAINEGRTIATQGEKSSAVPYARLAEDALRQARSLADNVANARGALEKALADVRTGVASISSDVSDAKRLGKGDALIAARQADAERVIAYASGSQVDPFRAVAQLTEAENALDAALAGVRNAEEIRQKAQQMAERNRAAARSSIDEADEYIDRYSRYVPGRARTQLAAANAAFAGGDASRDPQGASSSYEQANSLAKDALLIATRGVNDAQRSQFGGGPMRNSGSDWGSILGGMIIGSLLSGGNDRHHGGFSSGSFGGFGGGGFGGGGFSGGGGGGGGGSFGGSF